MNRIVRRERKGFKEGENLRDSEGLEKQLNNVRYDWQGGENSTEHVDSMYVLYEVALQLDKIIETKMVFGRAEVWP